MSKPMPIIDGDGKYVYVGNTRLLQRSTHPVFQARIDCALGINEWIGAPTRGHKLERFKRVRQSQHQIEEFRKSLEFYLDSYGPEVTDILVAGGGVTMDLDINGPVFNEVVEQDAALLLESGAPLLLESGAPLLLDNG